MVGRFGVRGKPTSHGNLVGALLRETEAIKSNLPRPSSFGSLEDF